MDDGSRLSVLIVIFLFIASAFFALTETAVASVSRTKIKVASDKGDVRAKRVLFVLDHFDEAITTLLICTNIAHIAAASLVTVLVTRRHGLSAVTASTFLVTIAMFFFGEMLPKSIGKKQSEKASLSVCGILRILMVICKPFSMILSGIGKLMLKIMKGEEEASVTEDELYDIIEDMAEEGSLNEEQEDLISSALQFADVNVSSILTPRVDVVGVDVEEAPEKVLDRILHQNHSRIVVYRDNIDHVIGVLQIRKFLKSYISTGIIPDAGELMDEVFYAHQSMAIDELLDEMSQKKLNMAVVLDAFGGTLGVVTVEDILEEIVGEIWDEDDEIREPIAELSEDTFIVSGDETVSDTLEFLDFDNVGPEDEERFTNLLMADWFLEQFTVIPEKEDSFAYGNLRLSIAEMDHNRILKILVKVLPEEKEAEE